MMIFFKKSILICIKTKCTNRNLSNDRYCVFRKAFLLKKEEAEKLNDLNGNNYRMKENV